MEQIIKTVVEYVSHFLYRYSFFIDSRYYREVFLKYMSLGGFISGVVLFILIYNSRSEEQTKASFIKVIPIIALINSCGAHSGHFTQQYYYTLNIGGVEVLYSSAANIISGFILTLVVISCYKGFGFRAFLLGVTVYAVVPLLNYYYYDHISMVILVYVIVRVVMVGVMCLIISNSNHFYTGWICYYSFHALFRIARYLLECFFPNGDVASPVLSLSGAYMLIMTFKADVIFFVFVLVFGLIFEKTIVSGAPAKI